MVGQDKVLLQPTCKRLSGCDDLQNTAVKRCSKFTWQRASHLVSLARVASNVDSPQLGHGFSAPGPGGTSHVATSLVGDVPRPGASVVRCVPRADYR